jgi:hypothetical protein
VLLAVFCWWQSRVTHPLLPLRVVLDRDRGGALTGIAVVGAGTFGIFLFLAYYMTSTLGYSPVQTGLGFLPMIAAISVAAGVVGSVRMPGRRGSSPSAPS